MITYASEKVAENNTTNFNLALKKLVDRKGSGIEYYEIRGSSIVEYNPVENKFYHHIEYNGYRYHSLGGILYLTDKEVNELYEEVGYGLITIRIVNSIDSNNHITLVYDKQNNIRIIK